MTDSEAAGTRADNVRDLSLSRDTAARALLLLQPMETIPVDLGPEERLDGADLVDLIKRAHRRHQVSSLLDRLPFSKSGETRILEPGSGVGTTGAVLLAFQVGAGIDTATLVSALGISEAAAGTEMYSARESLVGREIAGCGPVRTLLGRCADPGLRRNDFAALINHSKACQQCTQVLDEFRAVDERIETVCEAVSVPDAATGGNGRQYSQSVLLLWIPVILVVVLAVSALAAIGFSAATESEAAPLFNVPADDEHAGWLILSSETGILAVDLENGDRRRILESPAHDWWNPWTLSPDRTLAIRWEESAFGELRRGALRAFDMNGERQYLHRWQGPRSRMFSGWLDNQTVLFVERGAVRRAGVTSEIPLEAQPGIIAADLETGQERLLFQGALDKAVPSPHGAHIALIRPGQTPWPGKTIEIRPVTNDGLGPAVNTVEHRTLNWPSRMVWSDDGQSLYVTLIDEREIANPLPEDGEVAPSPYAFDRLLLARLGTDGSIIEFDSTPEPGWTVVQAISPDESTAAVLYNERQDRDGDWFHGAIDLETGQLSVSELAVHGSRWWNSEALWSPDGATRLIQQSSVNHFAEPTDEPVAESLVLLDSTRGNDPAPVLVFHDAAALNLQSGHGLSLLGWISNEQMQGRNTDETPTSPRPGTPSRVSQGTSAHRLFAESSVASTGRHVLIEQSEPDRGTRVRLLHRQAWAGPVSDFDGIRDYSWLPREAAAIGTLESNQRDDTGSRLIVLSSDRSSRMHNRLLDPADIGDRAHLQYRKPVVSPNGSHLAFYIDNERENLRALWVGSWDGPTEIVEQWEIPDDALIDPTPVIEWIGNGQFLYTRSSDWNDGYPQVVTLYRGSFRDDGSVESSELRSFTTSARDRGIDLDDLTIGPEHRNVAFRVRHYTERDPERGASDSIQVSPAQDLTQHIEIVRAEPGTGMTWLDSDDWLLATVSDRITLMDATGRHIESLTEEPSAYPVLVGDMEIWYQDLSDDGRIMRLTFTSE